MFGSYRAKVDYDLVVRQNNAYGILKAADFAVRQGIRTVSLIEFGVAAGTGLLNMAQIAGKVTRATGVSFKLYGFDSGRGMPPARDYRDHPDLYQKGDYVMNQDALKKVLPANVQLIIGEVTDTVSDFISRLPSDEPVGYVVFDLDYYFSMRDALKILRDANPQKYLPITLVFLDDIALDPHNHYCGELLAVNEFNAENPLRKIEHHAFLENSRIFRRAIWVKQMFFLHVLDHPSRCQITVRDNKRALFNPYLDFEGNRDNYIYKK
ncbi:MAG TPA: hypothetical protein VMH30_02910 [Verrucomicrobiae bacterium]|nr:hypothetical protein [Verrucomicrobiae bacterium]